VLFSPLPTDTAYLINIDGRVVQTWKSDFLANGFSYMLDNGRVLRGGSDPGSSVSVGEDRAGAFRSSTSTAR
jgi:hypothetical protein